MKHWENIHNKPDKSQWIELVTKALNRDNVEISSVQKQFFDLWGANKADIAFIENGNIKCIIECFIEDNDDSGVQFSKAFNRPEPWFKLDVKDFLEQYSKINNDVQDTSKDTSEDTSKDTSEDTSEDTSKDTSEDTTEDVKIIKINCLRNARYCHKCSELYKIEQERNRANNAQRILIGDRLRERRRRLQERRNEQNVPNVQTVSNVHNTCTGIWTQHISKKYNVPYWYNSETEESRWTKPDEVQTI